MDKDRWSVTLYDKDDRIISSYYVAGWAKINAMMITWSLRHQNIEYVKISAAPLDEGN